MLACSSLWLSRCCALVLDLGAVAVWHYVNVFLFAVAVAVCLCAVAVYLCIVAAVAYLRAIAAVYLSALVIFLCVSFVCLYGAFMLSLFVIVWSRALLSYARVQ